MRPACLTSEKLQKKQRSRTVQFFAVLCGFSYAPERLFLVILAVFLLIGGLAGEVHPQTLDGVRIHAGQDDRGVHVAALELGELLQSDSSFSAAELDSAIRISSVCRRGFRLPR